MGGSGGGGTTPAFSQSKLDNLRELISESREEAREKYLESDINSFVRELISSFERNSESVREKLDELGEALGDKIDFERLNFGGSVAKHTYVDGLSDVDALVVLSDQKYLDLSPTAVLNRFCKAIVEGLDKSKIASVEKGRLAATVKYKDGTEVQLLPAIKKGKAVVAIPNAKGKDWKEIRPGKFTKALTQANQKMDNRLVPSIKVIKSILSSLPASKRPSGYHVEALAMEAVRGYRGATTFKGLVERFFDSAKSAVMTPIKDPTGQSKAVDEYLGSRNSDARKKMSAAFGTILGKLQSAKSARAWKKLIED